MSMNFLMQYGRLNLNSKNLLSAKVFVKDKLYKKKFSKILELCIYAHSQMTQNETQLYDKDEETLRSMLKTYMQNNRGNFKLGNYHIDAESAEIDECTYKTLGYCDLKITIPTNNEWSNEPERYFTIECKRLDGSVNKNKLYISQGIHRFITEKYSKNMNIGGMIAFVENNKSSIKNINEFVENINKELIEDFKHQVDEKLLPYTITENFTNSYQSHHNINNKGRTINLIHLFFDNRNKEQVTA